MDKNQAKSLVLHYLSNLNQAKKELERVKQITELKKRREEVESAHQKRSSYSQLATGYYSSYNLSDEVNGNSIVEYDRIVKELWNLSHEVQDNQGQNQANRLSHCVQCDKKSTVYHFIWDKRTKKLEKSYNNVTDLNNEWVFCNQDCFNEWYKKWWSSFKDELKDLTCKNCKNKFQVECEYKRGKEITRNHDCCSRECLNSWNQKNLKEQNNKKQCSDCSTLLTSEEIYYCANCSAQQQQLRTKIMQLEQNPNRTPIEQAELEAKRKKLQELEELLRKQQNGSNNAKLSNKIALYIGVGIVGFFAILLILIILARNRQKRKTKH